MSNKQAISLKLIVSQSAGNLVSDMDGEKVMLNIDKGKYYNLGQLGGVIWELVEQPMAVQELVSTLCSLYQVEQSECENQVIEFLEKLMQEGLIQVKNFSS
ncbi:lasso peptide biosynthesis PqqD family chaperone [Domibacillus sp. PGB-M46]|uniref:lasso peptide biosynthesis PqqD family chaperone n=1 Tax=Domibacillus sp. PGB-M46 TaxID=2910255 RepID=UPI001F5A7908|nr:lasso peptide biosynthesis PqqD family chaperone [Domibacillus sp. PGB-M46]MCI2255186.1 lasso peptide biosynthesis PqqD family chaperone [Domibacillus sp. PGB-M46]